MARKGTKPNAEEQKLLAMIKAGEGLAVEFKTCRDTLNRDVYETVSAFSNRHGGTILLGINDAGKIMGVHPDAIARIKKDFVNTINNPQKVNPPAYLGIEELQVGESVVLRIYVPESSLVTRCNGRIYDRNEDGDLLKSAQLYQADPETGKSGLTLAGILLLGQQLPLLQAVPMNWVPACGR